MNETGFAIERSPDGTASLTPLAALATYLTTYQNTGLSAVHDVSLSSARDEQRPDGGWVWSNVANAQTTGTVPAAPTNLTATAVSSSQINLTWTDHDRRTRRRS